MTSGPAPRTATTATTAGPAPAPPPSRRWLSTSGGRVAGVLAALAAVFAVFTALEPSFSSVDNLSEIIVQSSIIGVVALGMTLVVVTGGIDLSVGSIVGLVTVVCATNLDTWGP